MSTFTKPSHINADDHGFILSQIQLARTDSFILVFNGGKSDGIVDEETSERIFKYLTADLRRLYPEYFQD